MIIDCHGHYTTAPAQLQEFRDIQVAHFEDPSKPAPALRDISDDEIRETIEKNQLRALKERGADVCMVPAYARIEQNFVFDLIEYRCNDRHIGKMCSAKKGIIDNQHIPPIP